MAREETEEGCLHRDRANFVGVHLHLSAASSRFQKEDVIQAPDDFAPTDVHCVNSGFHAENIHRSFSSNHANIRPGGRSPDFEP